MIPQVIIQAGGRGTRLESLTRNRPKCLVPVDGRPLLYHTFAAFPGASFTVIVDYRGDVVRRYLDAFPPGVEVRVVEADGDGTCGGIAKAAAGLDQDVPVAVVWCDLMFDAPVAVECPLYPVIYTTIELPCRMSLEGRGIVGLFGFPSPSMLIGVPKHGEFAEWLLRDPWKSQFFDIPAVREYGTAQALRDHWDSGPASRWFNSVEMGEKTVIKKAKAEEFQHLIDDEVAWYEKADYFEFRSVPHLASREPFMIERIQGRHPFEMEPSADRLHAIMDTIDEMHNVAECSTDRLAVREMYVDKPRTRLAHIPKLAPDYAVRDTIRINGRECRNPLRHPHMFTGLLDGLMPEYFAFIHGDPTFSNMLIEDRAGSGNAGAAAGHAGKVWLIDPRGRFGHVQFYGDPAYDWAKLWYSVVGGYDRFNRKRFVLTLDGPDVEIEIAPSGWERLAPLMAHRLGPDMMRRVRVLHGLIWLSLPGYVTEDYDASLAAWFKGMWELEQAAA